MLCRENYNALIVIMEIKNKNDNLWLANRRKHNIVNNTQYRSRCATGHGRLPMPLWWNR